MVHLYEHFVLCSSVLLSIYWIEASVMHDNKTKVDGTWKEGAFVSLMKEYKN